MIDGARLTEVVAEGDWGTVECVVLQSGKVPAREFLEKECEEIREKGKTQRMQPRVLGS